MKKFRFEMVNVHGENKEVVIEAKTKAKATRKWNELFGKFWLMVKAVEI